MFEKGVNNLLTSLKSLTLFGNNFREERSVLQHLFYLIFNVAVSGEETAGIFMDLSKAFESVKYTILIQKLKTVGVAYNSLDIESYFFLSLSVCIFTAAT